jgi:hypothetical protein
MRSDHQPEASCRHTVGFICIVCQEAADCEQKTSWNEIDTSLIMAA